MSDILTENMPDPNTTLLDKIMIRQKPVLFSVYWEIRLALYAGVLLFATGAAILIYKNIESIGHLTIVTSIGLAATLCWCYCLKNSQPFSFKKSSGTSILVDYLLLLAALLTVSLISYLQYQFHLFGQTEKLATAIPMIILFTAAYRFDHIGILSLAITNLGVFLGINVTPSSLLKSYQFNNEVIIYTGILLGLLLQAIATFSSYKNLKKHFAFTYKNFGINIFFISCLIAIFHFDVYIFWLPLFTIVAAWVAKKSIKEKSFYFLLMTVLYAYVALSFTVINLALKIDNSFSIVIMYFSFLYFIISAIGVIFLLINLNKKLKQHDNL